MMDGSVSQAIQSLYDSSLANRALIGLIALAVLRRANSALSSAAANSWQRPFSPWQPAKELALVTGGCSGIGLQIALDLARIQVKVVVVDIQEPTAANVFFYRADVTSSASIREVAELIRSQHGDPTVLVNNAGVAHAGTILSEPEHLIRQTFEVNAISHFLTVKEFLPSMIKQNHGHVITIASMASFVAIGEMADYACTKASALAFHESLSQEIRYWHKAGQVRTSVIHPLWVRTPMVKGLTDSGFNQPLLSPETVSAAVVKQIVSQTGGQVILPAKLTSYSWVRALPIWAQEFLRGYGSRKVKGIRDKQEQKAPQSQ